MQVKASVKFGRVTASVSINAWVLYSLVVLALAVYGFIAF